MFNEGGEADDEFTETFNRRDPLQCREAVDRHSIGSKILKLSLHRDQMILQPDSFRIDTNYFELALLFHLFKIHSPTAGVAEKLFAALLECKEQAALTIFETTGNELRGQ